ncbi:hypothetical protein OHS59_30250 [Streptomyces sp. NBC_00414]|uniref:hypothetical protein n=1 Tax=Streptomyces sp. NBC_00414 TaxID=2975739 RepID=UPI002E1B56E3
MDTVREPPVRKPYVRDDLAVRAWQLVREPFTAGTWRRVAYALLAVPVALAAVPVALLGGRAAAGRWQRGLVRRLLGTRLPGSSPGVRHALLALPLNLAVAAVTLYGWMVVPMNIGWPLRGGDPATSWGGPTFAGAWAFHAVLGGIGFLLLMPWVGRALAALQLRLATALLARP